MLKKDLAEALGISGAMVSKLSKKGMPVDTLERAQRWRKRHLEPTRVKGVRFDANQIESGAPKTVDPTDDDGLDDLPVDPENAGQYDLHAARAKREHWAAAREHDAYRLSSGELMERTQVLGHVHVATTEIRNSLESLPPILAPMLIGRTESQISAIMADQIERLLNNLSHRFEQLADASQQKENS